jgi:DNA processing protein
VNRAAQPPHDDASNDLVDAVRLSLISGVGPRLRKALLEEFGSAAAVLSAAPSELRRVQGIGPELTRRIAVAREDIDVQAELDLCAANGVAILSECDPAYPRALREIHDPPGVLFVRGEIRPQDALALAIVGSRHATHYGLAQAERLAGSLARAGLTIISGLARGIDAAAHRGALAAGGRTLAVLGSGVLNMYPPEHAALADEVVASGAVISESPPRSPPLSGAFPQRNRIISGMSLGVLVVEASARSGALISARHAMEQGREVFAVPGRVDNRMSHGCHRLIRDGAKLVETVDDVLEELGPLVAPTQTAGGEAVHHPAELMLNELEQQVLAKIASEPITIDAVLAASQLPAPQVLATISVLEMRRLVRRLSGNLIVRP